MFLVLLALLLFKPCFVHVFGFHHDGVPSEISDFLHLIWG